MRRRQFMQVGSAVAGLGIAGVPLSVLAAGKKGGVINAVVQPEPPGLMLGIIQNGPTHMVAGNIYEGLLRYDEKLTPGPELATSWTISPDGLTYTFKLKPRVTWHDGQPFTAADVVFSCDVFLRKTHARARANLAAVESIRALDAQTVQFKLKHPYSAFIGAFEVGSMPMVPRHIYEGTDFLDNPANATPIGTGPFKFEKWVRGSYIHLVRNQTYHDAGVPLVDAVYWHVIPDAAARATAFESGQVDVLPGGSVEYFDVARLSRLPGAAVTTRGWELFSPLSWIILNDRKAPFSNVKFRQAIMYALDRDLIAKVAWQGFAKTATGPFNSHVKFYSAATPTYRRDLPRARTLVAASGYRGETLRLLPIPYGETWQRTAEMVRQQLTHAGIKVELTATDVAGWNQRLNEWDFDMAFNYFYQYGDPALGVARNYITSQIARGSPFNNVEGYSNPKVDQLFEAGAMEVDPARRAAIYLKVQQILSAEVPVAWLHELTFPTIYRTRIHNLISSGVGIDDSLGRAWIA